MRDAGAWAARHAAAVRAGAWERAEGERRRRERVCGLNQGGVRKWAAGREREQLGPRGSGLGQLG